MDDNWGAFGDDDQPDPLADPLDALLADVAINVQLPPGLHKVAQDRYAAVRDHIGRRGSPLEGQVVQFYPQGSMAIDATISTRGTDEEYDLDVVAELDLRRNLPAAAVLDGLLNALEDYPVRRVTRQTRCVTLTYSDGMHIDVTPSRRVGVREFESVIFHAPPDEPAARHREVPMNAFGFAQWYRSRAPFEQSFSRSYSHRLNDALSARLTDEPIVHEVLPQAPVELKSATTVALQLVKRFRNIWSAEREERYPPSVMLSCHAGQAAMRGARLSDMLIREARWTARAIREAAASRGMLDVRNPVMRDDCFTDRWPENQRQQMDFAAALEDFANGLELLKQRKFGVQFEDMQPWLKRYFGDRVVGRSVKLFVARNGTAMRSSSQGYTRRGGLVIPAAPAVIGARPASASVVAARPHTNMGDRRR